MVNTLFSKALVVCLLALCIATAMPNDNLADSAHPILRLRNIRSAKQARH